MKSKATHDAQVKALQQEMGRGSGIGLKSHDGSSNTLRNPDYKKTSLDFSPLNEILEINEEEMTVTVEPRMTVSELTKATLRHGLIPLVVPEFTSITVGGAITGAAIESSSHRYGQFNDAAIEYEVLLGNGTLITASRIENSDLFFAISGSYGTLGLLTLVKLKLRKATPYVRLQFQPFKAFSPLVKALKEVDADFKEGIILSSNRSYLITADFKEKGQRAKKEHRSSPWFVDRLRALPSNKTSTVTMTTYDYLFRLDRGAFWMGHFLTQPTLLLRALFKWRLNTMAEAIRASKKKSPSWLFRALFGHFFSSRFLYKLWHRVPQDVAENLFFIHDFYAPALHAEEILTEFYQKTGITPIWLCPVKGTMTSQFLSPHKGGEAFINMGLYGIPKKGVVALSKELEESIVQFGGRKMLYSYTYYPEKRFEEIYNWPLYESLREKYHAYNFPTLYEKVVK